MKATHFSAGLVVYFLFAGAALAGNAAPLGAALGESLGLALGSALPIGSIGLLTVAAASLVAGIRIARRKQSKQSK